MTLLARVIGERFGFKSKFGKRRNTLCISSFTNWRVGEKDPSIADDNRVIVCLNKKGRCKQRPEGLS
jgi:hypothetical protein